MSKRDEYYPKESLTGLMGWGLLIATVSGVVIGLLGYFICKMFLP